ETRRETDEQTRHTLSTARRTAERTVAEAEAAAEKLLADARAEAAEVTSAARREVDELGRQRDGITSHLSQLRSLLGVVPSVGPGEPAQPAVQAGPGPAAAGAVDTGGAESTESGDGSEDAEGDVVEAELVEETSGSAARG
ncbi:MAG TPA: hypothetical protein VK894_05000, partial [Jiangellales bacterium]|nr:hypothetical protein [Jiangellales bacterium]